jgi:predicted NACHT family NTPase
MTIQVLYDNRIFVLSYKKYQKTKTRLPNKGKRVFMKKHLQKTIELLLLCCKTTLLISYIVISGLQTDN